MFCGIVVIIVIVVKIKFRFEIGRAFSFSFGERAGSVVFVDILKCFVDVLFL